MSEEDRWVQWKEFLNSYFGGQSLAQSLRGELGGVRIDSKGIHDRMCWVSLPSKADKIRYIRALYQGRSGVGGPWWDSDYGLPPESWTLPQMAVGVDTLEANPAWRNAIHLVNSKDGITPDGIYLGAKVEPNERWIIRVNARFPLQSSLRAGTYAPFGAEWPFQGGHTLYAVEVYNDATRMYTRLAKPNGTIYEALTPDISSWVNTGTWKAFWLVIDPPLVTFTDLTNSVSLTIPADVQSWPKVVPFFANEGHASNPAVASGIYVGQWAGWHIVSRSAADMKAHVTLINASSLAAGCASHADLDLRHVASMSVTARVTYGVGSTAGVRVYLLGSQDNANFDSENTTDALAHFDPTFATGATRQRTVNVDALPPYLRVLVRNLDAAVAHKAISVIASYLGG